MLMNVWGTISSGITTHGLILHCSILLHRVYLSVGATFPSRFSSVLFSLMHTYTHISLPHWPSSGVHICYCGFSLPVLCGHATRSVFGGRIFSCFGVRQSRSVLVAEFYSLIFSHVATATLLFRL